MGWKVIKATVSGISIMKQLVPHDDTIDPIPDSVFESGIDHSDSGLSISYLVPNINIRMSLNFTPMYARYDFEIWHG